MSDSISPLYAEILGETAQISWQELAPWFAKGQLLWVASGQDLVAVAEAIANDDKTLVASLMEQHLLQQLSDEQALQFHESDPELWATVVRPWVLVQERTSDTQPTQH